MALGSNRDYKKTAKITMQVLKKRGIARWFCSRCNRENWWHMHETCPRCGMDRPEEK